MQHTEIEALNDRVFAGSEFIARLTKSTAHVIVGQDHMIERLLIGLLTKGHVLLEGLPGLAKTLAIKTLANLVNGKFSRIQFTPDLFARRHCRDNDIQPGPESIFSKKRANICQFCACR